MRPAEATSNDTTWAAGVKSASSRVLDSAAGQFASVLSATRRSSQRVMDLVGTRSSGEAAATRSRAKDLKAAKADSRETRAESLRKDADSAAESRNRRRAESTERSRRKSDLDEQEISEEVCQEQEAVQAEVPEATADRALNQTACLGVSVAVADEQAGNVVVPGADSGSEVGQVSAATETSAVAANAATMGDGNGSAGSETTGSAAIHLGASNVVANTAVSVTSSDAEPDGSLSAIAATGKPATDSVVRPNAGGTAGEFQNLLQQLGRGRVGDAGPTALSDAKTQPTNAAGEDTMDMESAESVRDLARVVRSKIGPRDSSMTLAMSPPELGRLRIDVQMEQDELTVRFQTETQGGQDAIKGKLHELVSALEQQGVHVDRIEVEYVPPGSNAGNDQNAGSQAQQNSRQFQTPGEFGQSAGRGGQSFDAPRQSFDGESEFEPATNWTVDSLSAWSGMTSGVDLVA